MKIDARDGTPMGTPFTHKVIQTLKQDPMKTYFHDKLLEEGEDQTIELGSEIERPAQKNATLSKQQIDKKKPLTVPNEFSFATAKRDKIHEVQKTAGSISVG